MMKAQIEGVFRQIVADEGTEAVAGLNDEQIDEISQAWGIDELPSAYREFLRLMGRKAGRLLQGTRAFYPEILGLPELVTQFFAEDVGGMPLPADAIVFAMHQGYQVYWLADMQSPNPEVVLYMERRLEPMKVWPAFDAFLEDEYRRLLHLKIMR